MKGLNEQIAGLRKKIDRLKAEGKSVPLKKRRALINLIVAREQWRQRKRIVNTLMAGD